MILAGACPAITDQEGQRPAGDHRFEWNTSGLEAGMYYVTLLLDGQPVVKKAVKVAR